MGVGTILCVDDEKNVVNALKRELRNVADEVLTATSGEEALELFADREVADYFLKIKSSMRKIADARKI